jgi:hypothetical protein
LKRDQVTIAFPLPHAAMYSLSLKMPTLPKEPLPLATRAAVVHELPPSVDADTMMSAFLPVGEPWPKPKPSVAR